MTRTIEELLKRYSPSSLEETKSALREIMQSMILLGLSKADFFSKASFYGGTALRIFYGLNRYSEDLDFTLNEKNEDFTLDPYLESIKTVGLSYGLDFEVSSKSKKIKTPIESAFCKLNTYQTFIHLRMKEDILNILHKDEVLKVKFEVDCNPSLGFQTQSKWIDLPEFASVAVLDEESLFAGKIHAILTRNYKNHVKGRDYYDFLFYIQRRIKPNMSYLKNKLIETGKIKEEDHFDMSILKEMLKERFNTIDYKQVKEDASRFLFHQEDLSFYSSEFFKAMVEKM